MIELYVDGKLADISEESVIAVTKTYETIENPLNYYSEYSKTIKLPLSERNNSVFSNFAKQDSVVTTATIDYTKKIPFTLLYNKEQVMSGYLKLENANTIYTDEAYQVTLYSTFGMVMNTIKLLTFNTYATDVEPQYIVQSPFENARINREIVKASFEQESHDVNGDEITDWIGFIPTYQGKYSDFSSDRQQILNTGRTEDLPRERDEHYMREFRSYYQQPFIWVDKLWKVAKDKIMEINGYNLNLDASWFTQNNPYYSDLIYTCPTLFNEDDNFSAEAVNMQPLDNIINYIRTTRSLNPWDFNTTYLIGMQPTVADVDLYNNSTFNPNGDRGTTKFKGKFRLTLFAPNTVAGATYARIKPSNPFVVKFRAVNTLTNQEIDGAYKEFLIYSNDSIWAMAEVRDNADVGIAFKRLPQVSVPLSERMNLYVNGTQYGQPHTTSDGFYWETELNVEMNVYANAPYRMEMQIRNMNNDYPFEYTANTYVPNMFTTWNGFFEDTSNVDRGYSIYLDELECSCETTEFLRSSSELSLYRIFPKDTTLADVLLNYSKMCGLVWEIDDENKEITVMSRNRFFTDYTVKDWTDRIDRSKEFMLTPLAFDKRYVVFNFNEGDCGRLDKYESKYQASYGEKKIDTGYDFNTEKNELFNNLVPSVVCQKKQMSKMMNTYYEDRPNFMGYDYKVLPNEWYVDNDNEGSNAGMSGAFYFRNGTFAPDSQLSHWDVRGEYCVRVTDDTTHQSQTGEFCWNSCGENVALCYHLPDVGTVSKEYNGKQYSVHFAPPVEYFYNVSGDVEYLYHNYWENYINERYCSQNKKLTAYVYLKPNEYSAIDFREFIKIDNVLYHIDKIYDYNYNSDNPVKVDLVQVWDITAYTQGQQSFGYFFTVPEVVTLSSNNTVDYDAVDVYISDGDWAVVNGYPNWITAYKNNTDLMLKPNSTTTEYREGYVYLVKTGTVSLIRVKVVQYPQATCRLDTETQTIVTDWNSTVQMVSIDSSNLTRNAITVTTNKSWINAYILEYVSVGLPSLFRTNLHLVITINNNNSMNPRNGTVTLSMACGGNIMETVIHIGQQCAYRDRNIERSELVITDNDSPITVYNSNNQQVNSLEIGNSYHFNDIFGEEIDVNSIYITNGIVKISGNTGEQTITFIPQLSNGDTEGGGCIVATTMGGRTVSYNYNVSSPTPAPDARYLTIYADNGIFALFRTGIEPIKLDYYEDKVNDGEEITIEAADEKDGYYFKKWYDTFGNEYENPSLTFIVDPSIADGDSIIYKAEFAKEEPQPTTATFTVNSGGNGYITVGSDATHYQTYTTTVPVGTVITNITIVPDADFNFIGWSDGSQQNHRDYPVYQNTTLTPTYQYVGVDDFFYVEDASGIMNTLTITKSNANAESVDIYRSSDEANWVLAGTTSTTPLEIIIKPNSKVYLKAVTDNIADNNFDCTGDYNVGGNIMSLLYGNNFANATFTNSNESAFAHLFEGSTTLLDSRGIELPSNVVDNCYLDMFKDCTNMAYEPALPSTTTAVGCYAGMFEGCTSLMGAPELTATVLSNFCYNRMFKNCTSITTTPYLNATTLAESCYEGMFYGCTGLTTARDLPALTVSDYAYCEMFRGCTSLTTTPTISATTVGDNSMYGMFMYCTGLTTATALPATTLDDDCYFYMFKGCTSLTTAPTLPATTLTLECYYEMFADCTSLVNAPALPATVLTESCYKSMFAGCTSLTNPPVLTATVLADYCYQDMFAGCTSLNNITTYADDITATDCIDGWLFDVASTGDFYNNGSATYTVDSYSGIPVGWTEHLPQYYNVSISAGANGSVSVNGVSGNYSQSVLDGTVLTLAATPNAGYEFSGWSDGNNSNPRSLTVSGNTTLTAAFSAIQPSNTYFYVEDASGQANTLYIGKRDSYAPTITVYKSTDQVNWTSIGSTSTTPKTASIPPNGKLYLKAVCNSWSDSSGSANSLSCYGNFNVGGNIMSLLYGDNYNSSTFALNNAWAFANFLVYNTGLINASNLVLPTNTVQYCYYAMFSDCTSLTTAPALPATTMTPHCYQNMFNGCTSLAQAPNLSATTLAESCYSVMFSGCTNLFIAPTLPATTLKNYCYQTMFYGCTNLSVVITYANNISPTGCLSNWLGGVYATGHFYNYGTATYTSGASGIPVGWTEHTS